MAKGISITYTLGMFIERAYSDREGLSDRDLGRLMQRLSMELDATAMQNPQLSAERLEKHGLTFLAALKEKLFIVKKLIDGRARGLG